MYKRNQPKSMIYNKLDLLFSVQELKELKKMSFLLYLIGFITLCLLIPIYAGINKYREL